MLIVSLEHSFKESKLYTTFIFHYTFMLLFDQKTGIQFNDGYFNFDFLKMFSKIEFG